MTLPKKIEEKLDEFDRIDRENAEYEAQDMLAEMEASRKRTGEEVPVALSKEDEAAPEHPARVVHP